MFPVSWQAVRRAGRDLAGGFSVVNSAERLPRSRCRHMPFRRTRRCAAIAVHRAGRQAAGRRHSVTGSPDAVSTNRFRRRP